MAMVYLFRRARLEDGLRLEAEFYQPQYMSLPPALPNWRHIGDVITSCQYGSSLPLNEEGVGYPVFRLNEINNCFLTEPLKRVEMRHVEHERLKLQQNDVLFCRTNGNIELVGRTGILKRDVDAVFASYLVRVRTDAHQILPEFLTVYLNSSFGRLQIQRRAMRSNQVNVSATQLKAIPIPICSEAFQEIIAESVQAAAHRIADSTRLYRSAQQVLLGEVGLQNWTPPLGRSFVRSHAQLTRAGRMDAEHFQPRYAALRARISSYSHGSLNMSDIAALSNETLEPRTFLSLQFDYVELADVNEATGTIEHASHIRGQDAPGRARFLLRSGDVIASTIEGSLNKVALVSREYDGAIASTGFFVLRPRTVKGGYLLALTGSVIVQDQLRCEASGTILAAVSAKSFRNVVVPNIPLNKQTKIAELVQQAHAARHGAIEMLERAERAVDKAIEEGEDSAKESFTAT